MTAGREAAGDPMFAARRYLHSARKPPGKGKGVEVAASNRLDRLVVWYLTGV